LSEHPAHWNLQPQSSLIAKFHYMGPTGPDRTDRTKFADFK